MLSIEECKEYLGDELSDSQIEIFRNALYEIVEPILDNYLTNSYNKDDEENE